MITELFNNVKSSINFMQSVTTKVKDLTWPGLYVLAERFELCFPDCRLLVEDNRTAQTFRCPAQTLCVQFINIIL